MSVRIQAKGLFGSMQFLTTSDEVSPAFRDAVICKTVGDACAHINSLIARKWDDVQGQKFNVVNMAGDILETIEA